MKRNSFTNESKKIFFTVMLFALFSLGILVPKQEPVQAAVMSSSSEQLLNGDTAAVSEDVREEERIFRMKVFGVILVLTIFFIQLIFVLLIMRRALRKKY
ncbi:MAG: hypothetical protein ACK5ML_04200 [Lachnospiraceae bacterium]